MYFKEFPNIFYDFKYDGTNETKVSVVTDITRNIRFRKEILENVVMYDSYDIEDGDTPEIIAEKVYGNPQYHWIIMLANGAYDWTSDFPLEYQSLQKHIEDTYGTAADDIRHWETQTVGYDSDEDWHIVNSNYPGAVSITNRQYEERKNEEKRRIKIVSPDVVSVILKQYKDLL